MPGGGPAGKGRRFGGWRSCFGRSVVPELWSGPGTGVQILCGEFATKCDCFACSSDFLTSSSLCNEQGCGSKAAAPMTAPTSSAGPTCRTCGGCGLEQAPGYKFCGVSCSCDEIVVVRACLLHWAEVTCCCCQLMRRVVEQRLWHSLQNHRQSALPRAKEKRKRMSNHRRLRTSLPPPV